MIGCSAPITCSPESLMRRVDARPAGACVARRELARIGGLGMGCGLCSGGARSGTLGC